MALRSEVSASHFDNLPMCVTSVQHAYWSTCVFITCWVMLMCSSACLGPLSIYLCICLMPPDVFFYALASLVLLLHPDF